MLVEAEIEGQRITFAILGSLVSPMASSAVPGFLTDDVPITLDVWVDGQHSTRTTLGGVPIEGSINNVYLSLTPIAYGTDLWIEIQIVPIVGGQHRVGIGLNGINGGVDVSGPLGQPLDATLRIRGGLTAALGMGFGSCERNVEIILGKGVSVPGQILDVKSVIFTRGERFDPGADVYVEARGSDLYGTTGNVRTGECSDFFADIELPPAVGFAQANFAQDWVIYVNDAPTEIRIREGQSVEFPNGYHIETSQPVSGGGSGVVEKFGTRIPINLDFNGARSASAYWKDTQPWLYLGAGPAHTGHHVGATVVGEFGMKATRLLNGNVYFANSFAFDNELASGTCASAFYTMARECAE